MASAETVAGHAPDAGVEDHDGVRLVEFFAMPPDVCVRTQHALLLAGKQDEADGALRAYARGLERPQRVNHQGGIATVIESAGAQLPGVEVRSQDYELL